MLRWHRQPVVLKSEHVAFDGFADVRDGGLATLALRDAAREAGALGHPEAVFAGINNHLSHGGGYRLRLKAQLQRFSTGADRVSFRIALLHAELRRLYARA